MEERMYKQYGLYPSSLLFERERENVWSKSILLPVGHTAYISAINIFWLFMCIYFVFICAFLSNAYKSVQWNTSINKENQ